MPAADASVFNDVDAAELELHDGRRASDTAGLDLLVDDHHDAEQQRHLDHVELVDVLAVFVFVLVDAFVFILVDAVVFVLVDASRVLVVEHDDVPLGIDDVVVLQHHDEELT